MTEILSPGTSTAFYHSPLGVLAITASDAGLLSVTYHDDHKIHEESFNIQNHPILKACQEQFDGYFSGSRRNFNLPVDFESLPGTGFQKTVWRLLQEIPYGETITYRELSQRYGDPKAVRAVGHANGQNRINLIIPCHRVIGAGGKLTGYGGGLWRKEWLLRFEKQNSPFGLFGEMSGKK